MTKQDMQQRLFEVARSKKEGELDCSSGCYCVVCSCDVEEGTFKEFGGFCWLCAVRIALGEMPANEHPDDPNHSYT